MMKNLRPFLSLFIALFLFGMPSRSFAQLDTEFWFAAPELTESILPGTGGPRDRPIQMVVSTLEKPAVVEILQPADLTFTPIKLTMAANTTQIVNLTPFINRIESKPENTVLKTGFLIRSTQSISAYYEIRSANNTDIFALKGANANGKLFYVPFQTHWNNANDLNGNLYEPKTYASFDIVATDDSTEVTVTPTRELVGHPANLPFTFMLNRGQVYSCRAIDRFGANHPAGSKIESSKEVAVTMKDDMLQFAPPVPGADVAGDQLIPVEYWGQQYVLVKGGLSNNQDRCYILAAEDNTIIRVDGNAIPLDTLNEGEQYELQMTKESYFLSSNKKVTVLHISGILDQVGGAIIPALNCTGTNRIGFTRTNSATFIVNVITKNTAIQNFTLNGDPNLVPASAFQPILGSNGWMFARINFSTSQIPAGTTLLLQNSGDELFHVGVTNYAAGVGSNYGYFSNFSRLNLGIDKNLCVGDTAILDAGPAKTSYLWNTGATTRTIETLDPGTYWVNTLSGTQCPKTDTIRVRFYAPTFSLGPDDTICIGGSRLIEPSGVFTYTWQDGSTQTTFTATQAGVYWAQVADFQGCTTRDSLVIFEFPRPQTPIASIGDTVCQGGQVSLTMGNVDNATYAWLSPTGNIISGKSILVNTANQPGGAYSAFIKINGCESFFDTAYVGIDLPPQLNLGADTVICASSGSLVLDPGGHLGGQSYLWSTGSTDTSITISSSGTYKVTAGNIGGCTSADSIQVLFQGTPDPAVFSGTNAFCSGQTAVFGVVSQPNYSYRWTGPNGFQFTGSQVTIPAISNVQAGVYSVVPVLNGCEGLSQDVTITVNPSPVVNLGPDSAACAAFSLVLDPGNFGPGFTYTWSTGSSDSTLSISTAGTYSVAVTTGNCTKTDTIRVTFGAGPSFVTPTGNRNYCAGSDALFGVIPVSGETYAWTGPNGFTFNGPEISLTNVQTQQAGVYSVTPSVPGCPGTTIPFTLIVRPSPVIAPMADTSVCQNGSLVLDPVPNGGEETFYQWSNGKADSTLTVTSPGTYSVIATFGLCQAFDTVQVSSAPSPALTPILGDSLLCSGASASFGVASSPGVSFTWTGPNGFSFQGENISIPSVNDNQFGVYTVQPKLGNCNGPSSQIRLQNALPATILFPNDTSLCGISSLLLDPVAFGSGITYLWSTGSTDSSLTITSAGTYKLTISASGCSKTDSIVIGSQPQPNPVVLSGETNYCQGDTLSLNASIQTGVQVSWTGPGGFSSSGNNIQIQPINRNLSGQYIATPVLNGCPGQADTVLVQIGNLAVVELGPDANICSGSSILLDPVQGSQGFSFLWNTGSTDTSIVVSTSDTFYVRVSDGTCVSSDTVVIQFGTTPSPLTISGPTEVCTGSSASLITNPDPGVVVQWTGPNGFAATGSSISIPGFQSTQAGSYIATSSLNGCPGIGDTITIAVGSGPAVALGPNQSLCNGGSVTLDPVLNGAGLTYLWNTGSTDSVLVVTLPGQYSVVVSGGTGNCSGSDTILVSAGVNPDFAPISGDTAYCTGSSALLFVSEQPGVTYTWTGPNGFSASGDSITVPNLTTGSAGLYSVLPSQGTCLGQPDTIQLVLVVAPVVNLGSDDTLCGNSLFTLDPTNGQAGFTYEWNVGSTDSVLVVNQSGTYGVVVRNQGCTRSDSITLVFNPFPLSVTIEADAAQCAGDTLLAQLQGTQTGAVYNWSGPAGFSASGVSISIPALTLSNAGTYTVVPFLNGCEGTPTTVNVVVNAQPEANLGLDLQTCTGTSFLLDPVQQSGGLTFLWNTGSTDTSLVVSQSGTYSVSISNGSNCVARDTINVLFLDAPGPVSFTGDTVYCEGETGSFGIQAAAGVSATWSGPNGFIFSGTNISLSNINVSQSGYYVALPASGSCLGTADSVFVLVQPKPTVNLGPDTSFCGNFPYVLVPAGTGAQTYLWNTGSTDNQLPVSSTGQFWVEVQNQAECRVRDTVNVTFKPNPEPIVVVKGSTTLCAGQLASFEVVDQPVATLVWSGPNGFSSEGPTASVVVSPQTAGIYFVSSSLDGCPGAPVSVVLTNAPQPKLILTADSLVCKGSRKPVQVASDSGATYFWSNNVSAAQTELGVGTHWVEVLLNGCRVRDTFQIRNSGPTAAFTTVPDSLLQVYQEVRFLDQSLAGTSAITNWEWNLGFSQIRTIQNPAFTYQANGPVDIQLIVRDNAGCTDTLIRTLEILPQQGWLIPSLFTPNNDGENDSFELGDLSKYPGTKVNIFDRWGKEQFSSSDYKNDWKGGDLVEGVYYYHVARSDGQSFQGYVYLRR